MVVATIFAVALIVTNAAWFIRWIQNPDVLIKLLPPAIQQRLADQVEIADPLADKFKAIEERDATAEILERKRVDIDTLEHALEQANDLSKRRVHRILELEAAWQSSKDQLATAKAELVNALRPVHQHQRRGPAAAPQDGPFADLSTFSLDQVARLEGSALTILRNRVNKEWRTRR